MTPPDDVARDVERCARQLIESSGRPAASRAYGDLLALIRTLDQRFAFDDDGRPAAIEAVRNALPMMERDLLDAIVEDFGCQLAAAAEAARQIALAAAAHRF
jgi:hypothetical protein